MPTIISTLLETVGSFGNLVEVKVTSPGTTSVAIGIDKLHQIQGAIVQILDSGDRVATSDADITWSGNTLTIANGGSFNLADTQVIYALVWGIPRR